MNPAYINYDSTHRAVSDTEKSAWNGKQSALTVKQLVAINSGIDDAKVAQIETNKNDIVNIKDGTNINSFGDVETALATKANVDNVYKLALTDADLLPANTDLDNVKTVGCYYVLASATVSTITNRPTNNTSAFRLTVEYAAGGKRARQIYQEFNSFDKYIRWENSSNVFCEWRKVECDLSTKQNTISDLSTIRSGAALGTTAVQPETGKGLSTNDYTTTEKTKLAGIAEGAEVNEIESIKVNNTTINPDANKVVNITVPTSAADVSALPNTTKYAAALSLTINSSTYVMTGQLKDQNGDNLGTAQTIDLPLESVVVNGSYDSQTKKVVLTLQNGNTIEFSVADLVSGLQTELSASNKLNPAFIEYDSTHRAVSDTEKSTWNSKQNTIDSTHKLSADNVDDTNATNKFATAEELEQIQTNKNNISSNWGAKNLLVNRGSLRRISADDDITYTWVNGDVSVKGHKGSEGKHTVNVIPVTPLSDLGLSDKVVISNNGTNCLLDVIFWSETLGPSSIYEIVSGSNIIDIPSGYTHIMARLGVKEGALGSINETIQPMICTKKQWDISHEYQPYPFSNAELTVAEKQNENNISLLQDQVGYAISELEEVL